MSRELRAFRYAAQHQDINTGIYTGIFGCRFHDKCPGIQQSIDASDFSHIDFEISVAEIEIEVFDGDTVEIDIELRAERSWWIFGRGDVDDIDLTVRRDSDGLELILDEDDVERDWRVHLPSHMAVGFELGVGEI